MSTAPAGPNLEPVIKPRDGELEAAVKLRDGYASGIQHHEGLEVQYTTWFMAIIGGLMAALAWVMAHGSEFKFPISRIFVVLICLVGICLSYVVLHLHKGLMEYIDILKDKRNAAEEFIALRLPDPIHRALMPQEKQHPQKLLRGKLQFVFRLFAFIWIILGIIFILLPQRFL